MDDRILKLLILSPNVSGEYSHQCYHLKGSEQQRNDILGYEVKPTTMIYTRGRVKIVRQCVLFHEKKLHQEIAIHTRFTYLLFNIAASFFSGSIATRNLGDSSSILEVINATANV